MTLSDISIRNPVFAWMLMAIIILFGLISLSRLGISQMPDVDFPVVTVRAEYEGASPEVMEVDVVDVLEDAVMTVEGIKALSSVARNEQATITVEFDLDRDIDLAMQDIQNKISQILPRLPGDMDPPMVTKSNPEDNPIMWVSLSGDVERRFLMKYARDHVKDRLQTISGVSEVILGGYLEPNLRVWINPKKLQRYELTVQDIISAIGEEHIEIPAGRVDTETKEYSLRYFGEASQVEDFKNILIKRRVSGGPIYTRLRLKDVARVEKGLEDIRRISRTNFKSAIGLGIRKQRGANAVAVAREIKKRLAGIQDKLPQGLTAQVNYDSTQYIEESTKELQFTLILSAILTGVVCLFSLGSVKSSFNILLAIPTSIIGSFIAIYFLGFTLNTFTMLGLILAIGIVVDDAIMVLENIVRHQELGKNRIKAALDGARQITPAAVAATISVIAIFIPVIFMEGIVGKFFYQFGVTMSVAVALSLLEALTLTPMRASRFREKQERKTVFFKWIDRQFYNLSQVYTVVLSWCLRNRWKVLLFSVMIFVLSLFSLKGVKQEFVPAQDRGSFMIRAQTPLGSSLEFTNQSVQQIEKIIMSHPEVVRYYTAIGGFGGGESNSAIFFITLKEKSERPVSVQFGHRLSQQDLIQVMRKKMQNLPNLKVFIQDLSTAGFSARRGFPVEFTIRGSDWEKLVDLSEEFQERMKKSDYFLDVDSNYKFGIPEIQLIPDRASAAEKNVSLESIGLTIQALVGGVRFGKFTEEGRRNDIRLRVPEHEIEVKHLLKNLFVRNQNGQLISLEDVVQVHTRKTLQSITREDRERAITIYANVGQNYSQSESLTKVEEIAEEILPENYRVFFGGAAQSFQESFISLVLVLLLGIVVAYMVLASQYNSFIHPFTVLLALPFSVSGAFVSLWLFGQSLNVYSFIGLILLTGIAKKNSILLVDFTNQWREKGDDVQTALMQACPTRLRPILMTTFATIAAAIPPALALGAGAENHRPMAVIVIGGMIVSTLMTLFVVPSAYSLLSNLEREDEVLSSAMQSD